jgi:dTDP-4-amino-4,6-dideoxygalactose transaminase
VQQKRARIWWRYHDELRDTCERLEWQQPFVPADCEGASHLYFVVVDSLERRTAFIEFLAAAGVQAVFHYQPLHRSPYAESAGFGGARCPVTDVAADRLVRLPFYFDLSDAQQTRVIETIREFAAGQ